MNKATGTPNSGSYFRTVIADAVAPALASHGFRANRKVDLFRARDGDCEFQVACDFLLDRTRDGGSVQICLAIGFRTIWKHLSQFAPFHERSIFSGAGIGERLELLIPRDVEPKWRWLDSSTNCVLAGHELREHMQNYGMYFFDTYGVLDNAIRYWESNRALLDDHYALVLAHILRGRKDVAERALETLRMRLQQDLVDRPNVQNQRRLDTFHHFQDFLASIAIIP